MIALWSGPWITLRQNFVGSASQDGNCKKGIVERRSALHSHGESAEQDTLPAPSPLFHRPEKAAQCKQGPGQPGRLQHSLLLSPPVLFRRLSLAFYHSRVLARFGLAANIYYLDLELVAISIIKVIDEFVPNY